MPAIVSDEIESGAAGGRIPQEKSPRCRSLPSIGGPAFPIWALKKPRRTDSASGRIASEAPRSRISGATTSPFQAPVGQPVRLPRDAAAAAPRRSPACPSDRNPFPWNATPSKRTSFPVKKAFRRLSVARVSTMPRRISTRSSGVERGGDRLAPQETVAGRKRRGARLAEPLDRRALAASSRECRRGAGRLEDALQLLRGRQAQRLDRPGVAPRLAGAGTGLERLERRLEGEGKLLRHERGEARRKRRARPRWLPRVPSCVPLRRGC